MSDKAEPICIRAIKAPAVWPLTTLYLSAVVTISAIAEGYIDVMTGILALGMLAMFLLLIIMFKELHVVHLVVNSERDALVARIGQLVTALTEAGVSIPCDSSNLDRPRRNP